MTGPRRVLVAGAGVASAAGVGVEAFWRGLTTGPALVAAPPGLATTGVPCVAAVPESSTFGRLRHGRNNRVLNRTFELLVSASQLAVEDARGGPIPPSRFAVVVGLSPIDQYTSDLEAAARGATTPAGVDVARFVELAAAMHPFRRLRMLPNIGAALLSIEHQAMGPSLTFVGGHLSGLEAIAEGLAMVRDGRADAVLCGGAASRFDALAVRLFDRQSELSRLGDARGACRPFDRRRSGVVLGEGAAMVLLEGAESATARGVTSRVELVAVASAAPGEGSIGQAMRRVLQAASLDTPDLLIAHGEGGRSSDRLEALAIEPTRPRCITSIQPVVGHTMSACGAMNLVGACLMLRHQCVPPIWGLEDPEADLPFATRLQSRPVAHVALNAIQPDGAAASALLTRA